MLTFGPRRLSRKTAAMIRRIVFSSENAKAARAQTVAPAKTMEIPMIAKAPTRVRLASTSSNP